MTDFLTTFRFLLKQNLSFHYFFNRLKNDKKYRNMSIIIILVFLFCIPSYAVFIGLFRELFISFQTAHLGSLYLVMAIILSVFLIIFFSFFQIISYFYFSDDVKILTPMPIKPSHYLLSKFFVIYIWELLISMFTVLPFFIIYAVYENIYFYQWIMMIISFVLLPIIPLVVIAIITVVLMSLTNIFKSKDALRMASYILLFVSLVFFQYKIYDVLLTMPEDPEKQLEFGQNLVNNSTFFLEKFSAYYPITKFIEFAVSGSFFESLLSTSIFILLCIGFVYLLSIVLQSIFMKSYLKEQNNRTTKKKKIRTNKKTGVGNVGLSIAKIDFLTLLRVPIYAFNTLSVVILIPVLLIVFSNLMSGGNGEIEELLNLYKNNRDIFWLSVALILTIFSIMNPIASTTFSREGKTNWIMRSLPISAKDHIWGRLLTPLITQVVFMIVMLIIIIFTLAQKGSNISTDIVYGIITFLLAFISSLPLLFISIIIDLKRPMLKWENPQQPVKQNMNVLIAIVVGIIYGTLMYLLYTLLKQFLEIDLIIIIFFIVNISLAYFAYNILYSKFEKSLVVMD